MDTGDEQTEERMEESEYDVEATEEKLSEKESANKRTTEQQ